MKAYQKIAAISALLLSVFSPGRASADDCAALGGSIVGSECQVSTTVSRSGTYSITGTLRITGSGEIDVPVLNTGNVLTLNVAGDFIMDVGSVIDGFAPATSQRAAS